jgi:regulator of replication initiation timing
LNMAESGQQTHLHLESLEKRIETLLTELDEIISHVEKFSREKNPVQINGQLVAIGDTIRKLEKQGILIPDDLRKIKINLSSDICKVEEVERLRSKLAYQLRESLTRLASQIQPVTETKPAAASIPTPPKRRKKKVQDDKSMELFPWPSSNRN